MNNEYIKIYSLAAHDFLHHIHCFMINNTCNSLAIVQQNVRRCLYWTGHPLSSTANSKDPDEMPQAPFYHCLKEFRGGGGSDKEIKVHIYLCASRQRINLLMTCTHTMLLHNLKETTRKNNKSKHVYNYVRDEIDALILILHGPEVIFLYTQLK